MAGELVRVHAFVCAIDSTLLVWQHPRNLIRRTDCNARNETALIPFSMGTHSILKGAVHPIMMERGRHLCLPRANA